MIKNSFAKLGLIVCLGLFGVTAVAHEHDNDHEMARQALINGDVMSLQEVLESVGKTQEGQAIKIRFEEEDGRYIYKIKLLRKDGGLAKLAVDASNGDIIRIKERSRK